jgi:hypothetical protein
MSVKAFSILTLVVLWTATSNATNATDLINMKLYPQQQSNWCWAAATETVSTLMNSGKSQCKMASRFVLQQPGDFCCQGQNGSSDICDKPYPTPDALDHYGYLDRYFAGPLTTQDIVGELQKHYPIGIRVLWEDGENGGTGHVMLLYGAQTYKSGETFNLWNPAPIGKGDRQVVSRAGLVHYQNRGTWSHTYLIKKP